MRLRLQDLREDNDLTQQAVADFLQIRRGTYGNYERGERPVPIDILEALAGYYKTSVDYIIGITDEIQPYPRNKCFLHMRK